MVLLAGHQISLLLVDLDELLQTNSLKEVDHRVLEVQVRFMVVHQINLQPEHVMEGHQMRLLVEHVTVGLRINY